MKWYLPAHTGGVEVAACTLVLSAMALKKRRTMQHYCSPAHPPTTIAVAQATGARRLSALRPHSHGMPASLRCRPRPPPCPAHRLPAVPRWQTTARSPRSWHATACRPARGAAALKGHTSSCRAGLAAAAATFNEAARFQDWQGWHSGCQGRLTSQTCKVPIQPARDHVAEHPRRTGH